jgi:NAD(P)-dependent dehydrogenase (short-subunit alcohol dehydrogenase family)
VAGICADRVVVITGAGRGIGRGHALEFARQGAKVVVNDLGGDVHGGGRASEVAESVVAEIEAIGGEAIANGEDVSDHEGAGRLIQSAIDAFGRLDVLVNNAGILRDRMLVNMTVEEWDAVIRVHLRGTFCCSQHAAAYWRGRAKAGETLDARIINTASPSGLYGNPGQSNYGAAKAAIASFTIITSRELERYGVTVNAVSPGARTRMTENLGFGSVELKEGEFDYYASDNIAPVVVWLASPQSKRITGRVFEAAGGRIGIAEGWRRGPHVSKDARWEPEAVGPAIEELLAQAAPVTPMREES